MSRRDDEREKKRERLRRRSARRERLLEAERPAYLPERRLPESTITTAFELNGVQWMFRQPIVTRYLEERWIREFFEEGKLRLSSFVQFAKHKDEARGDRAEGLSIVTTQGKDAWMAVVTQSAENGYVLSTAMREGSDLARDFGTKSRFRIVNTFEFATAIAKKIPGFQAGMEGPCIYQSEGNLIARVDRSKDFADHAVVQDAVTRGGAEMRGDDPDLRMFLKAERFQRQCEYRFLWFTDHRVDGTLSVECPDAVRWCERA